MPTEREADTTEDAVLGGRLILRQPRRGHRVGHDAILLAAATEALAGEHAVEFGAGVGVAGLALARRIVGVSATQVEIDPALAAFAQENAARNGLADRVRVAVPAAGVADRGDGLHPGNESKYFSTVLWFSTYFFGASFGMNFRLAELMQKRWPVG